MWNVFVTCDDVHYRLPGLPKVTQVTPGSRNRNLGKFQLSFSEPLCTEVLPYMTWIANPRWERFVVSYEIMMQNIHLIRTTYKVTK